MNTHGHVRPNPDGSKARCGGPTICSVCAREKAQHDSDWRSIAAELAEALRSIQAYDAKVGDALTNGRREELRDALARYDRAAKKGRDK